jgi:uncharacterized membrane protein YccC
MIFAAKTTLSALIALLVAFTFNLDQPQWALLTVFIVAQPQSGLVLAKSFYRIIGTFTGAAVALLLVSLFAQERVLFLGALALWIGLCTFGSQYARNFTAYGFVLSGYTAAIVGIPGALDAGNAFYVAMARVTEISLGIIATATVSRVILPSSLANSLWQAIADIRERLAQYALALLGSRDVASVRSKLISQAITIENLRASAVFEDREVRGRSSSLRLLNTALINVVGAGQRLHDGLESLRRTGEQADAAIDQAVSEIGTMVEAWRAGSIDAAGLCARLLLPCARVPLPLADFTAALSAYAEAYEACFSGQNRAPGRVAFAHSEDFITALWTGLRAALALFLVSVFWILSDWPHGSTAAILAAVATARLATMGHAVPISLAATLIFGLATIPAFLVVDVLLPQASGFEMFALIVAPAIFCCALLMAHQKTLLIGYLSGLLFASVGQFQNRMAYDPVGLINTSIAAVCAAGTALVLWSVLAPEDTQAACSRFLRVARQALARLTEPGRRIGLAEFETTITEALDQLQSHLRPDRPDDIAAFEAGIAFLGAGRQLIRSPERDSAISAMSSPGTFAPPGGWDGGSSKHWAGVSVAEQRKGALHDAS